MVKPPVSTNAGAPKSLLLRKRFVDVVAGMKKQAPGRFLLEADNVLASCKFPWQYKALEQISKTNRVDELVFLAGQLGLAVVVYKGEPSFYRIGKFNALISELDSSVSIHEGPCSLPILLEEGASRPSLAVGPFIDKSRDRLDQLLQLGKKETDFIGETGSKLLSSIMGRAAMLGLAAFFVDGELVLAPVKAVEGVVQEKYSEGRPGPGYLRTFAKQQVLAPYRTAGVALATFGADEKDKSLAEQEGRGLMLTEVFGSQLQNSKWYKIKQGGTLTKAFFEGSVELVCNDRRAAVLLGGLPLGLALCGYALHSPGAYFLCGSAVFLDIIIGIAGGVDALRFAMANTFVEKIKDIIKYKKVPAKDIARFLMEHCSKKEQTILIRQMGRFFGPGKEVKKALKAMEAEVADNLAADKKRLLEMQKKQEEISPDETKES